jgi:hypothetical protein
LQASGGGFDQLCPLHGHGIYFVDEQARREQGRREDGREGGRSEGGGGGEGGGVVVLRGRRRRREAGRKVSVGVGVVEGGGKGGEMA